MKADIHPLVDFHLRNWALWMRHPGLRLGYPARSAGIQCGGISGDDAFDCLCEQADEHAAVVMNRIIDDLSPDEAAAINHQYLHAVYRLRNLEASFERAVGRVWRAMLANGLA